MESKFICLADFLSYEEGVLLFNNLEDSGIKALVKGCGPPSVPFGEGLFFQILVSENDFTAAMEIFENVQPLLQQIRNKIECPKCKSAEVFKPKTIPFWQRIYYAGTEVYKCENCRKSFPS